MKSISELINLSLGDAKITNQRQSVVKMFSDRMPEIDKKRLAIRLSHLSVQDLYYFYSQCNKANHFGKFFNWSLKTKK